MSQINNNSTAAPLVDIESRIAAQTKSSLIPTASSVATPAQSFEQALRAAGKGITLSGHAQTRLASRQIVLTDSDLTKLSAAMDKAAKKGVRSSLVLMDKPGQTDGQVGLVVSIPNRTVITAVDTQALRENIFTNIDSAMIV